MYSLSSSPDLPPLFDNFFDLAVVSEANTDTGQELENVSSLVPVVSKANTGTSQESEDVSSLGKRTREETNDSVQSEPPTKRPYHWPPDLKKTIIELWMNKKTYQEISQEVRLSVEVVKKGLIRMTKNGLTDRAQLEKFLSMKKTAKEVPNPKRHYEHWTAERKKELVARILAQESIEKIAEDLKCSTRTVYLERKQLNITTSSSRSTPWDANQIADLTQRRKAGESWEEICKALGRTKPSVQNKWRDLRNKKPDSNSLQYPL